MTEKQPPHVEQALAEIAGTTNAEQVKAGQKRLAASGHKTPQVDSSQEAERKTAPKGRATRQEARGATA